MSKTTVPGPLDAAGFKGRSKSFAVITSGKSWPTCRACGSTLYPSRRESSTKYRCRCGVGREVRRPWEEGAQAA
jgi:hypothetical protein